MLSWPAASAGQAQTLELMPGAKYDPKIPTLASVLGHEPAERIAPPESIATYLKALHAAAPERTRLVEYARTWEGRPLHVLVVASAERIASLDAIKTRAQDGSPTRAACRAPTPTASSRACRSSSG